MKEANYIALNQDRIKGRLKDPSSAQFQGVFVSHKSGSPVVCGQVNAKNGFGGYSGSQRFISAGPVQVLESDMAAGEMEVAWLKMCAV